MGEEEKGGSEEAQGAPRVRAYGVHRRGGSGQRSSPHFPGDQTGVEPRVCPRVLVLSTCRTRMGISRDAGAAGGAT